MILAITITNAAVDAVTLATNAIYSGDAFKHVCKIATAWRDLTAPETLCVVALASAQIAAYVRDTNLKVITVTTLQSAKEAFNA